MSRTTRALAAIAVCTVVGAGGVAKADVPPCAPTQVLMSRSMDAKDRVGAAESLARYSPRAAVPILTPMGGALQHCGLPQVAPARHAKAACPVEVQQGLLGSPRK